MIQYDPASHYSIIRSETGVCACSPHSITQQKKELVQFGKEKYKQTKNMEGCVFKKTIEALIL